MQKMNWYYYRPDEGCDDKFICQYMRLDYLIRLLEEKQYYVKRRRTFEDANECYKNNKLMFAPWPVGNNCTSQSQSKERWIPYTDIIHCPTSCWSKHERESYLMWKSYATEIGACIRTTVHNFIASLQIDLDIVNSENRVLCGSMNYDYFKPSTIEDNQLFDKDIVYADENEFRFYFLLASDTEKKNDEKKGIDVPVDTKIMIDEILLSPFICKEAANRIMRMIKCTYDIDVRLSNIKIRP
jgi:hypothetical protein